MKDFVEKPSNGVIVFSMGSSVKSEFFSEATKQIFIKAFSELPYNFIWKIDKNFQLDLTDNIRSYNWIPQNALLSKFWL